MKKPLEKLTDQRGFAIFGAILILALVTVIGVAAIATSTSERRTATNFLIYERVFYTAEAGLEFAKEKLRKGLQPQISTVNSGGTLNWDFALTGATVGTPEVTPNDFPNSIDFDGNTYTIRVKDNNDDLDPADDSDGLIWIISEARGPRNSNCTIETLVMATPNSSPIAGYNAQEGGGSGKNYTSNDATSISFTAAGFGGRRMNVGG
jgi:hypothetical protein